MIRTRSKFLIPLFAAATLAGCDDSPTDSGNDARLVVQLTDAPSDYLESAVVEIGAIEILPADGAPIRVVSDAGTYDLLQLQNGVTADLGVIDIEPGTYHQLRMIVERAEVTLKEGYTFTTGERTRTIRVPSGAQTGIKINLSSADADSGEGVEIRPGETVLVVDFDVSRNFVMQGSADTPAGIKGFLFTPSLRAAVRDVAGSISGTVTAPAGVTVEGLSVTATRTGSAIGDTPAATLVNADGSYTIHFLPPASYTVTVADPPAEHQPTAVEVTVGEAQDVTGVDLLIELTAAPSPSS